MASEDAQLSQEEQQKRMDAVTQEFQRSHVESLHTDNLNAEQKALLEQAQAALAKDGVAKPEDGHLLQFLKTKDFDVAAALTAYKTFLQWRADHKIDEILDKPPAASKLVGKIIPSLFSGVDKQGIPIYIERTGCIHAPQLLQHVDQADFLAHHAWGLENMRLQMRKSSAQRGKPIHTFNTILDLSGLSLAHRNALSFLQVSTAFDEKYYPEIVERVFVINCPWIAPGLWEMVKLFLSENLKSKVIVLGWNWKEELLKYIDADQLPVEYGGTAQMEFPVATVEAVEEEAAKASAGLEFKDDYVAAGDILHSECKLAPGEEVTWAWSVNDGYDLNFTVTVEAEGAAPVEVKAVERAVTNKGSYVASAASTIKFKWDNTFSYFYGKYMKYHIGTRKV